MPRSSDIERPLRAAMGSLQGFDRPQGRFTSERDPLGRPSTGLWKQLSTVEWTVLAGLVAAAVAVRFYVVANYSINWDEFGYLSHVHSHLRDQLGLKVQTFHVHFFGWLPSVSRNEVDQIVAARLVMLVLQFITAWLLYRIGRRLTNGPAALFAVAGYLTFSLVIRGGASFRTDPIAICLIMAAFELLQTRDGGVVRASASGLLFAIAGMVTIKASLLVPSLVILLCAPLVAGKPAVKARRRMIVTLATAVVGFAALYAVHAHGLNAEGPSTTAVASNSISRGVMQAGFFPQRQVFILTLKWDTVYWAFMLIGVFILFRRLHEATVDNRGRLIEVIALVAPVATLAFYRNSFPYFYPFVLAPASVLTAVTWQMLPSHRPMAAVLKLFAVAWLGSNVILHGLVATRYTPLQPQRDVLEAIHKMFPRPVPYLDRCSMVGSFPQVGLFMSTWVMQNYSERGEAVLLRAIEEKQPPLLVANHPLLDLENAVYPPSWTYRPELLSKDRNALLGTYIHHWGPIYVAGKHFEVPGAGGEIRIDLAITGPYTLEASAPIWIDNRRILPGQSVELTRGVHRVSSADYAERVTLRWGRELYLPKNAPPDQPVFLGF